MFYLCGVERQGAVMVANYQYKKIFIVYIIVAKIQKLKTKFKCLDFEISEFENIRLFHSGIGDDYHFIHSKKNDDVITVFNSFVKRDNERIKHIGLIFNDLRFLKRVNKEKIPNIFNPDYLSKIFYISINFNDLSYSRMQGFDLAHNADYLRCEIFNKKSVESAC
jgi:hypothetical protein